jgi:hypothetical protein
MREVAVRGEMEMIGLRTGSSGRLTGDIAGLYEGYREGYPIGSPGEAGYRTGNPEAQTASIELKNGTLVVNVRHLTPVRRERGQNPWRDGGDPWTNPPPGPANILPEHAMPLERGGPPSGRPPSGGPRGGGPPGDDGPPGPMPVKHLRRVQLSIDGERSTGIYAGATGETFLEVPEHREFGYMEVETPNGLLHMTFTEHPEEGKLVGDLEVDGAKSTGTYANARGQLKFALDIYRGIGLGKGPYWGTIWLASPAETPASAGRSN